MTSPFIRSSVSRKLLCIPEESGLFRPHRLGNAVRIVSGREKSVRNLGKQCWAAGEPEKTANEKKAYDHPIPTSIIDPPSQPVLDYQARAMGVRLLDKQLGLDHGAMCLSNSRNETDPKFCECAEVVPTFCRQLSVGDAVLASAVLLPPLYP